MSLRKIFAVAALIGVAFLAGGITCYSYFFEKIIRQVDTSTEDLLLEKTMVLQFLREGHLSDADAQLESIAWNQMVSLGHRVEQGQSVPVRLRPAVEYNCNYFRAHEPTPYARPAELRSYWCALLQKK